MAVTVSGLDEFLINLQQTSEKAVRGAAAQMQVEADEIARVAKLMAPVDEHDLEDAIKVTKEKGGRDALGRFTKASFNIGVDPLAITRDNKTFVGEYAYMIHEHLAPYGDLKLGEKSRAKQAGNPYLVGGKFLERAAALVEDGITNRIATLVTRIVT